MTGSGHLDGLMVPTPSGAKCAECGEVVKSKRVILVETLYGPVFFCSGACALAN